MSQIQEWGLKKGSLVYDRRIPNLRMGKLEANPISDTNIQVRWLNEPVGSRNRFEQCSAKDISPMRGK